jgi:hypothetical protein
MRFLFIWLVSNLFVVFSLSAQDVTANLDKLGMFVGDQAQLNINISGWTEAPIEYIAWDSLSKKNIECLQIAPAKILSNSERVVSAKITTFEAGELNIPPIMVVIKFNGTLIDTFYTNPLKIMVYEVQPDSIGLLPIKDIIEEIENISDYYLPIGIVFLAMLSIGVFMFWRQKNMRKEAIIYEQNQTAKAKALRKLKNLEAENYPQKGAIKLFCSELTFILREYLANQYQFSALEMTTSELLFFCKENNILEAQNADLQYIMNVSDYIKFAEGGAGNAFFTKALEDVKTIINI